MQIKNNHSNNLQNHWLIGIIKLILFISCAYYITQKLIGETKDHHTFKFPDGFNYTVCIVLLLMLLNWYLEARRWKISLIDFEKINIKAAWKVVLSGLALGWVLPFTSGDLIAKISQQKDKYQTVSAAIMNRSIMLVFTLILGTYGISYLSINYGINYWTPVIIIVLAIIFMLFSRKWLDRFLVYFKNLESATLRKVFLVSLVRYLVFVSQFYLLLKLFLPFLEPHLLVAGIGWIFLIRSVIPLFLGGVGIREASGIVFFEPYVSEIQLVIIPIFIIWIINTVFPSIVGLVFILKLRYSDMK